MSMLLKHGHIRSLQIVIIVIIINCSRTEHRNQAEDHFMAAWVDSRSLFKTARITIACGKDCPIFLWPPNQLPTAKLILSL